MLPGLLLCVPQPSLLDYSIQQWKQTPKMQIEDAYKWLFHATLGGEHAVTDDTGPRQWMDREWSTLDKPFPKEPLTVHLTPDGKLIRVNLRPYRAQKGDKDFLLAVFVASAQQFHADKREFAQVWASLGARLRNRELMGLKYSEWVRLDKACRKDGWPAIEHSDAYLTSYRPAYRVVRGAIFP